MRREEDPFGIVCNGVKALASFCGFRIQFDGKYGHRSFFCIFEKKKTNFVFLIFFLPLERRRRKKKAEMMTTEWLKGNKGRKTH